MAQENNPTKSVNPNHLIRLSSYSKRNRLSLSDVYRKIKSGEIERRKVYVIDGMKFILNEEG